jgi:hypothetical protein
MIALIVSGGYLIRVKRFDFSPRWRLTGVHARNAGLFLLVVGIPYVFLTPLDVWVSLLPRAVLIEVVTHSFLGIVYDYVLLPLAVAAPLVLGVLIASRPIAGEQERPQVIRPLWAYLVIAGLLLPPVLLWAMSEQQPTHDDTASTCPPKEGDTPAQVTACWGGHDHEMTSGAYTFWYWGLNQQVMFVNGRVSSTMVSR